MPEKKVAVLLGLTQDMEAYLEPTLKREGFEVSDFTPDVNLTEKDVFYLKPANLDATIIKHVLASIRERVGNTVKITLVAKLAYPANSFGANVEVVSPENLKTAE